MPERWIVSTFVAHNRHQMMKKFLPIIIYLCIGVSQTLSGQSVRKQSLSITVVDSETSEALPGATVELFNREKSKIGAVTDINGKMHIEIDKTTYRIVISYLGYKKEERMITANKPVHLAIKLQPNENLLNEIVITASESKGLTTSSRIDKSAMQHLQPTSFSDLLELLPGGVAKDPSMGSANLIRMREAGSPSSDYDISSLGTSFVVDGVPLSADANLQVSSSPSSTSSKQQGFVSKGIDMRSISTDNIQSVEIIRGIPSVEYGDLTSGVVKIQRKDKATPLEARFKADQFSKLFYVGKGFALGNQPNILNVSMDYLDSKTDPRNTMENYKRFTGSMRLATRKNIRQSLLEWNSNLDYSGSFDNEKSDVDADEKLDKYSSGYNRIAWGNTIRWTPSGKHVLRSLELRSSLSVQFDRLKQTKNVYLNVPSSVPNSTEEGEHDGVFLPFNYIAHLTVDGKPLNAFVKLRSEYGFRSWVAKHALLIGAEYSVDKNFGKGEQYDPTRPPSSTMRGRPRAYSDIPALQKLSLYTEDNITVPIGEHRFNVLAGVRGSMMPGMDRAYSLHNKIYLDPRANAQWSFPAFSLFGKETTITVGGGYGIQTKTPTMAQLYPDKIYYDIEELNYYHNKPELRKLYLMTHIWDPTNYRLEAARNYKWELRTDITFAGNRLSITYFKESCHTGFRSISDVKSLFYKRYDTSGIDPDELTSAPDPSALPYEEIQMLTSFSRTGNGSQLNKEGVEFQFQSKRIPKINTRITINGAWFETLYNIDAPVYEQPSIVLDGKRFPYYGIYDSNDGSRKEQFNTNLMFDTYLPKLGLTFSTSAQCIWFTSSNTLAKNQIPYAYVDASGNLHEYTEASQADPVLQWLVRKEYATTHQRVPMAVMFNLKATKQFGKYINLALFVNKILDYTPDYKRNGLTIHRSVSPYFGMEANFKF